MIRLVDEQPRKSAPVRSLNPSTDSGWLDWEEGLQQWVRTRPGLALVMAVTVGAALAWLVKRRT